MIQIYDGRECFYQWDTNQRVTSDQFMLGDEIHFFSIKHPTALITVAYELDGCIVADVPNLLLQKSYPITIYRVSVNDGRATLYEKQFKVNQRAKPDDYVYTETEVRTYNTLVADIEELKNSELNSEEVNAIIAKYLEENPVDHPIKYLESTSDNVLDLFSLESGTYILKGSFRPYPTATRYLSFSKLQLVSVSKGSLSTCVQVFYPPYNAIQYLNIWKDEDTTDGYDYERKDAKLYYMEDTRYRVTEITEDADDDHYPSAKAVYDFINDVAIKSVNGIAPDENGNVEIEVEVNPEAVAEAVNEYMTENPADVPSALPNPNALTFTGAVEATYDGSEAVSVEIPSGGEWRSVIDFTTEESVSQLSFPYKGELGSAINGATLVYIDINIPLNSEQTTRGTLDIYVHHTGGYKSANLLNNATSTVPASSGYEGFARLFLIPASPEELCTYVLGNRRNGEYGSTVITSITGGMTATDDTDKLSLVFSTDTAFASGTHICVEVK